MAAQSQIPSTPPSPVEKLQDYFDILDADLKLLLSENSSENLSRVRYCLKNQL